MKQNIKVGLIIVSCLFCGIVGAIFFPQNIIINKEIIIEKEILRHYVYMEYNGSAVPLMLDESTNTYYLHSLVYRNLSDGNYYFYDNSGNVFIWFIDFGEGISALPLIGVGDKGLSFDFDKSGFVNYNNKEK